MIFIPNNVPSLKNSKQISITGKRPILLPSKTVKKYLQSMGVKKFSSTKKTVEDYASRKNIFRESVGDYFHGASSPCMIGFNFVRDSNRKFDFINAAQIICDLLTAHGFIKDDDMKHLIPMPLSINGSWYSVCRDNPGVWMKRIESVPCELTAAVYYRN